ncbi:protein kinase [Candidatus Uabimicrobium sp. HlEnr_7]|uniref:protein kinase domain-containing protein n=1 Tax=Candidatus Uabimicrobium helgolandensis TaxID=3095367 RepID=UPI003557A18E
MTGGIEKKYSEVLSAASRYEWQEAYNALSEISQQSPENPSIVMARKCLVNLQEQQYELAGSILENALLEDQNNPLLLELHTIYQKLIDETSKVNTDKKSLAKKDGMVVYQSNSDMTISECANVSEDATISEVGDKTNVGGISTTADTNKYLKSETLPSENTPTPGVPSEATLVDSNIENPWDLESSAATMVMSEGEKPDNSFIDASTITKAHKIGPYHDLVEIGRGGMGIVYKAFDTENNRYVALKTIREEDVPEEIRKRFTREMDIVSKLDHPNIIRIFDKFFYNNRMFFSMEFIEGKTLKELQEQGRPFPLEETIEIVVKICDALEHAHAKSIIHRDLKPSNIMLDINNHVKVVDFGIAKKMDEEKYTRTGQVVGSIQYMPPEQMNGSVHDIDERSDVYTIGTILYELVMKVPPFPLPKIKDEMPKRLKAICLKCLHESKEGRYQNVTQLKNDLQQFSKSFQETKAERTYAFVKRIAVFLTIVALSTYSWFLYGDGDKLREKITQNNAEISHLQDELSLRKLEIKKLSGDILFRDGKFLKAIDLYNDVLEKTSQATAIIIAKGLCYSALGDYEKAIELFSKAIEKQREDPELYYHRGFAYHQLRDYPRAIPDYKKTLLFKNEHLKALWELSKIYHRKQNWKELHSYLQQIIDLHDKKSINTSQAKAYLLMSDMYLQKNDRVRAIRHLLFAYFIDQEISFSEQQKIAFDLAMNNDPFFTRCLQLFEQVYPKVALMWLKEHASYTKPVLYSAAGFLHENNKEYGEAKILYEKGMEYSNAHAVSRLSHLYNKGWGVDQDPKKSVDLLKNAIEKNLYNGDVFFSLAHAYNKGYGVIQNTAKSRELYQKAATSSNYNAMYELGILSYKRRKYKEAYTWIQKAVEHHSTKGMHGLAKFYRRGTYVMKNDKKAEELISQAKAIEDYYK